MQYLGEIISIGVAMSWTMSAILCEYGSKRMGSIVLNCYRMLCTLLFSFAFFLIVFGSPLPLPASSRACFWLMLSGVIGYVICDYCLMKCYTIIGSRYGQLFMTLAPISAAITAWITMGEELRAQSWIAIFVTLSGIAISVLGRGEKRKVAVKLPAKGVFFAATAAVFQGMGLVVSKIGMNYYAADMPAQLLDEKPWLLPFCCNFFRCIAGIIGFSILLFTSHSVGQFKKEAKDGKVQLSIVGATIFGTFIGVAFSLLAVQYVEAGIASTLMATTPIFILLPSYFLFHQKLSWKVVIGAVISVLGVSLFFLLD